MKRAYAIDALRGLAIIGMVLSSSVSSTLPAWMYHAQVGPRSNFIYDPAICGISWVDLVFPFFLFSMGAAFPLALTRKLNSGVTIGSLLPKIIKRTLLLLFFAVTIYHCTPYNILQEAGNWAYLIAILAFGGWFLSFAHFPNSSESKNSWLNRIGYLIIILIVIFIVSTYKSSFPAGFKLSQNDSIILLLANMAFFGAVIWLLTRKNWIIRLGIMGIFFALRLTSNVSGSWNTALWNFNPMQLLPDSIIQYLYVNHTWLYQMDSLRYLLIIIPGTIVGDILYQWINTPNEEKMLLFPNDKNKIIIVGCSMFLFLAGNLYFLFTRQLVAALFFNILLGMINYLLLRKVKGSLPKLYRRLFSWGTFWMILGLCFEAFEGGIRKDHATMSYLFITSALAIFTLILFSIIIDYFQKEKPVRYLVECGQNPMVAYVANSFVVVPILTLTMLMKYINLLPEVHPWFGLISGIVVTGCVMYITVLTVRKKLFWKT
jgi:predicted acyltransferase